MLIGFVWLGRWGREWRCCCGHRGWSQFDWFRVRVVDDEKYCLLSSWWFARNHGEDDGLGLGWLYNVWERRSWGIGRKRMGSEMRT